MTARRIVAVIAAIVLIGGALLLRNAIDDDDAEADGPTGSTVAGTSPDVGTDAATVICSTELEAACTAIRDAHPELDVEVEPAGETLDRLAALADGTEPPVWLTVAPFPEMVDSLRTAAGLEPLAGTGDPLAATPLVVATPTGGRAEVLAAGCAETPLWRCIGANASAPWTDLGGEAAWGKLRPSLGLVDTDATALGSFADAVAGYLGAPTFSTPSASDPAFLAWLRQLAGAVSPAALSAGTPLDTMATRPAVDIAATSEAARIGLGATADRFDPSYPEPSMWLEAVLAVPDGITVPDDIAGLAAAALADAGWAGAATAAQSLPAASTMLALRALWQEAAT
ncbi:MAG: hypothetical protein ABW195_06415 [Ilumatobacteraceae bacterium]